MTTPFLVWGHEAAFLVYLVFAAIVAMRSSRTLHAALFLAVMLFTAAWAQAFVAVYLGFAPVWLEGTRDGRPLKPADVSMAAEGIHPAAFPAKLPDIEPQDASDEEKPDWNVLSPPPADRPGVHLWLLMSPGRKVMDLDRETRERLKALGYLGN